MVSMLVGSMHSSPSPFDAHTHFLLEKHVESVPHILCSSCYVVAVLWDVYGDCMNFQVLTGHKNAVMQVDWSMDGETVYSASADKTVGVWDAMVSQRYTRYSSLLLTLLYTIDAAGFFRLASRFTAINDCFLVHHCTAPSQTGTKLRMFKGHSSMVNSVNPCRRGADPLIVSASDDGAMKIWDTRRAGGAVTTLQDKFQLLAVTFNERANQIISAGIENDIKVWDVRKGEILHTMKGHTDTVTGLRLTKDGNFV